MTTKSEKMAIWNAVSQTDPNHTKQVEFGRKFTAIDAHYQIKLATEQFGPIGIGWGYDASDPIFTADGLVVVSVTLWHGDRANKFGPVHGCAATKFKDKVDSDAPKKAGTDALTKLLSQLGFNADVFMGRFDDNKYVEEMRAKFSDFPAGPAKTKTDLQAKIKAVHLALSKAVDGFEINDIVNKNEALFEQLEKALPQWWNGDGGDKIGLKKTIENYQEQFERKAAA